MRFREIFKFREESNPEQVKPFLDHLEDLRWMLVKMGTSLAFFMVLAFGFRVQLMRVLLWPLESVSPDYTLQWLGPADSIYTSFKLAFYAGMVLAFPFLLYFLAQFVLPGLTQVEKKYLYPSVAVGFGLFLTGVLFCYFVVLPLALAFFARDAQLMGLKAQWEGTKYLGLVTQFVFAFGLTFELPVVVMFLVKLGLLTHAMLKRTRSYATVVLLSIAAILTPTTDVLTLLLMAGPMLVLYEICIWLSWLFEKKERKRAAEAEAAEAAAAAAAAAAHRPPPAPPAPAPAPAHSPAVDTYEYGYDSGFDDHWEEGSTGHDTPTPEPAAPPRRAVHPARKAGWNADPHPRGARDAGRRRGGWKTGKW